MVKGPLTKSAVDALVDALRQRVLDGQIVGGRGLSEWEIASSYNVSRPTAKTAINQLVHSNILRKQPHKSARVPIMTVDDIDDLFLARAPIELEAVRRIAGRRPPTTAASNAVRDLTTLPPDAATSRYVEADIRFHQALIDAAGSPQLRRLFALLSSEIHLSMLQSERVLGIDRIAREHGLILDALGQRQDAGLAERLMTEHLEGAHLAQVGSSH